MSRILTIAIFPLLLAGCANEPTNYDKAAVPDATAELRQATTLCEEKQTPAKFNASQFMTCRVAAERNFAMAIHVRKMEAFDIYAGKMLALAADYDAGQVKLARMNARAASIRTDYWRACDCGPAGGRGGDYTGGAFVPSSDLTPPGVQLSSTP
jgi:hypothetical protein